MIEPLASGDLGRWTPELETPRLMGQAWESPATNGKRGEHFTKNIRNHKEKWRQLFRNLLFRPGNEASEKFAEEHLRCSYATIYHSPPAARYLERLRRAPVANGIQHLGQEDFLDPIQAATKEFVHCLATWNDRFSRYSREYALGDVDAVIRGLDEHLIDLADGKFADADGPVNKESAKQARPLWALALV
ncbi:hypothetical protein B0T14DRAFT_561517 [Immersiella caudata]|uniref:Uncharacterized protein n=1 Tax=Immersiella caudata TaxID=314043 RepID=A0AA39XHA3_9PEZI|nr:hypothetical protein B0T14DRAFT_561517 [Immersiella caudata]